jgi:hypothetical protein
MLAVVLAALRSVHGAETVEQEVSLYYIAHEIAETYRGMMIAIPADAWRVFRTMSTAAMGATLLELAQKVQLRTFRKTPRGPKKPRPKPEENSQRSHVSTARLLMERKANFATP